MLRFFFLQQVFCSSDYLANVETRKILFCFLTVEEELKKRNFLLSKLEDHSIDSCYRHFDHCSIFRVIPQPKKSNYISLSLVFLESTGTFLMKMKNCTQVRTQKRICKMILNIEEGGEDENLK